MLLQYYRIRKDALPPERANPSDAGLDLRYNPEDYATEATKINPGESVLLQTGLRFAIPHGHMLEIKNRSSIGVKKSLIVGACVVDSGYDGEVFVNLHNIGTEAQFVTRGEKIAQAVVIPVVSARFIESHDPNIYGWYPITISNRGTGALGSTDKVNKKVGHEEDKKVYGTTKPKLFGNEKQTTIENDSYYKISNDLGENILSKDMLKEYVGAQIERHAEKSYKTRDEDFYFKVGEKINDLFNDNIIPQKNHYNMICLGTRNNYERDSFSRFFSSTKLFIKQDLTFNYAYEIGGICQKLAKRSAQNKLQRDVDLFFKENNEEIMEIIKRHYYPQSTVDVKSLDIAPDSEADYVMDFNSFPEDWYSKWNIIYSNALDHSLSATDTFREWVRILDNDGILVIGVVFERLFNGDSAANNHDCCTFEQKQFVNFIKEEKNVRIICDFDVNGYTHYVIMKQQHEEDKKS